MRLRLIVLSFVLSAAPVHASLAPGALNGLFFHQHPGAQLPLDANLISASGQHLSLASALAGKPAIVILEYLRCKNLCSLVLSGAVQALKSAQLTPGREFNLIAISIDPRENSRDAAVAAAMYANRFPNPAAASTGVRFFTAPQQDVQKIASAIGFPYRYDRLTDQFAHPAGFVVTTPSAKISRYMLGLSPNPNLMRQALNEASHDAVEPPAHPLLLLCFGYDPDEGTVAALAMRLVRIASFAMIAAIVLLIAFLSLRRRRPA